MDGRMREMNTQRCKQVLVCRSACCPQEIVAFIERRELRARKRSLVQYLRTRDRTTWARVMWRYAIAVVLRDVAACMPYARWNALIRTLRARTAYQALYRVTLPHDGTPGDIEVAAVPSMLDPHYQWIMCLSETMRLSADNVLYCRALARVQAHCEAARLTSEEETIVKTLDRRRDAMHAGEEPLVTSLRAAPAPNPRATLGSQSPRPNMAHGAATLRKTFDSFSTGMKGLSMGSNIRLASLEATDISQSPSAGPLPSPVVEAPSGRPESAREESESFFSRSAATEKLLSWAQSVLPRFCAKGTPIYHLAITSLSIELRSS
jgi:hypothetical protein